MMNENYNTPNSGCCGRPFPTAPENKCNYNDCCMNEYAYKQKACIRNKQPDCEAQAVIPSITVETVDGITNLANCLVHVTSTNTTYYVDDKHRIMITWAGPVNIPGYDMEGNPNNYKNQIVTDVEAGTAVIYDNHGKGYIFGITLESLQQAVNDKLDDMTEEGTLQEIITTYIQSNVAWAFDTVADMKTATNLVNGSYAQTLGFYNTNDGGSALYKIRSKTESDVVDEMFIIALNDLSLVAELITNKTIRPESVGVYGDGTTDCTVKLQALVNYAYNNSLEIDGHGEYVISDTITLPNISYIKLKLNNVNATAIVDKPAFLLDHCRYPSIKINSILFTKGSVVDVHNSYTHQSAFLLKSVSYAKIEVKSIQNSLCAFTLYSDGGSGTDGCYYNKLSCEKADTFNVIHYYNEDGAVNGNELNGTLHIVSEWVNPNNITFYTIINEAHTDGGTIYKNNHNVANNLMVEKYTNDGMSYEIADLTDASNFFIYVDRIEIIPSLDTAHIATSNSNTQYNLIKINSGWETIPLPNTRFGNNNYIVTFNNYKNTLNNVLYINNGGATLENTFSPVTNGICDGTITYNPAVGMVRFNGLFTNANALTANTNYTFANFKLKGKTCTHGYVYSVSGGNPTNMTQIGTIRRVKDQYYCTMRLSQNVNAGSYLFVDFTAEE